MYPTRIRRFIKRLRESFIKFTIIEINMKHTHTHTHTHTYIYINTIS